MSRKGFRPVVVVVVAVVDPYMFLHVSAFVFMSVQEAPGDRDKVDKPRRATPTVASRLQSGW